MPVEGPDCAAAATLVEAEAGLPSGLLHAIGQVETGRPVPGANRIEPWPWSTNLDGFDHVFGSKREAIEWTAAALAEGRRSIDVGCFQVNLMYHPSAFATLDDAFDPLANARYAAAFLSALHRGSGSWQVAAADYHSSDPELGEPYGRRVFEFLGNPLLDGGFRAPADTAMPNGRRVASAFPASRRMFGMRFYTPAWAATPSAIPKAPLPGPRLTSSPIDLVVLHFGPVGRSRHWPRIVRPD